MSTMLKTVVYGVIVWALVLVVVRLLGSTVFSDGNPLLVVAYLAMFPLGIAFTYITRSILNVPMRDLLEPMAILATVALMFDGISFAFTDVYGVGDHEIYAAAFLLWAPGVFMLCAVWLVNRAQRLGG
jgi:hypothetical protein